MGRLLLVGSMLLLSGCEYAPSIHQKAAEKFAEDLCKGFVFEIIHEGSIGKSYLGDTHKMVYKCVDEGGTTTAEIIYKDIPVKFFKEDL